MNHLHALAQRLAALGQQPPNAAARREVLEALAGKAHGIRINAAKVLAAWGDAESLEALKGLLVAYVAAAGPLATADLATIVRLLVPHVARLEREWVMDLYLGLPNANAEHALRELLYAFPFRATAAALAARYRAGQHVAQIPAVLEQMQFYAFVHQRKD